MYLRTHTTAVSARMLYRVAQETVFVPQKLFSIGNYSNKLIILPLFMKTHRPPPHTRILAADVSLCISSVIAEKYESKILLNPRI